MYKQSRVKLLNIEIDNLTMEESLDAIETLIELNNDSYVVTPNIDHIVKVESDKELKHIYENANLILCDGKPLIWISKLYGTPLKEKVSGSDLFPRLCQRAAQKGYRMFFLGAEDGVAIEAANRLRKKYTSLNVVGTYSPCVGFEDDPSEMSKVKSIIKKTKPHILIVALGCPKQEYFIWSNRNDLGVPVSLGLGASLDFEAGRKKRAPKWMSEHGLEWLYRTVQDPKRLIKRYFIDDIRIFRLLWKYRKKSVRGF